MRLDAFTPQRLDDPVVRGLMRRLELRVDPEIDAEFPGRRAARVIVHAVDGRRIERYQPTRKGDPDLPLGDTELDAKYRELTAPVVGAERAERLLETLRSIESVGTVTDIRLDTALAAPRPALVAG